MNKIAFNIVLLIITFGLTNAFSQSNHLFVVGRDNSMADNCCRTGFIDELGNLKIHFQFYYATEFKEGMSAVLLTKGGKWGYINEKGSIIIKPQFEEASTFSNGFAEVSKNGKKFFITTNGKKAFNTSFRLLGFQEELSPAQLFGKWGFINQQGKVVISFKFQNANPFSENLSAVMQNNLVGYIDKTGNWVIPPKLSPMVGYSDSLFLPNFSEGLAVYKNKDKYGFINQRGDEVIVADFERAESFSEELALVRLQGKVGYLNKDGQFVIEPKFENGNKFSEGLASVQVFGKWGYVDTKGRVQIQPQYDSAENFKNGLARVSNYDEKTRNTVISYINKNGKLIYSWKQ